MENCGAKVIVDGAGKYGFGGIPHALGFVVLSRYY